MAVVISIPVDQQNSPTTKNCKHRAKIGEVERDDATAPNPGTIDRQIIERCPDSEQKSKTHTFNSCPLKCINEFKPMSFVSGTRMSAIHWTRDG
ncbi:MAG: hypothetical protein JWL86_5310 [Rhizobium sp.]|nr:hypothetical protein [Rhizobium sp.]